MYHTQIYDTKQLYLGTFDNAKDAAIEYDKAAIKAGKSLSRLNFPDKAPRNYAVKNGGLNPRNGSGYRGVSKKSKYGYRAYIKINGKQIYLGTFHCKRQAAIAYDYAVHQHKATRIFHRDELNFPTMEHDFHQKPKGRKKQHLSTTGIKGVDIIYSGTFRARLRIDGKTKYLGTYGSVNEASDAYDIAIITDLLKGGMKTETV